MSKIRKLYYFDKKRIKEMIPFLNSKDSYIHHFMFNPLIPLHHLLPLKLKFLPESYVLKDRDKIKGLITIAPLKSANGRMEIQRLFFDENCDENARELIQYVISKYKAMGAFSFIVKVNYDIPNLIKLFISKCDFSKISHEKLWEIPVQTVKKEHYKNIRSFKNSDAHTISTLYNESLLPHIRPLLCSSNKEFKEQLLKGLSYYTEYKYVVEDYKTKNLIGYISIKTYDGQNYIIDVIQSSWINIDIETIIAFCTQQVQKRQKHFNLYFKTKRYTQIGEKYEEIFFEHKFKCVQSQIILTNSSAQIIKEEATSGKFTILNQIYNLGVNVPS